MYVSQPVFGLACLIGGLILTFAWPLGPRRGNHILLSISHRYPVRAGGL